MCRVFLRLYSALPIPPLVFPFPHFLGDLIVRQEFFFLVVSAWYDSVLVCPFPPAPPLALRSPVLAHPLAVPAAAVELSCGRVWSACRAVPGPLGGASVAAGHTGYDSLIRNRRLFHFPLCHVVFLSPCLRLYLRTLAVAEDQMFTDGDFFVLTSYCRREWWRRVFR